MRHLTEQQSLATLRRGAAIEQMLTDNLGDRVVRWLSVVPSDGGFAVHLHLVHDDGDADFLDVHAFRSVDEEEDFGEGRQLGRYPDAAAALNAAVEVGGRSDKWVNAGVIQDEYADLRRTTL